MNKLIPYQDKSLAILGQTLLNPLAKRVDRVSAWLILLETQAKELLKQEYQDSTFEETPWLALSEDELKLDDPSSLDESKRMWYYKYHMLVLDKIADLSVMVCEDAQGTISKAIQEKKRKMLLWAKIENISEATQEIASQIKLDTDRADHRQMAALLNRQDELEQAGVTPETLLEVFSRKPRFAITAGALVGTISKDDTLTNEEKNAQIKDVMEQAASVAKSTQIKSNHRGISAQFETTQINGKTVLHILCETQNDFSTVFGKLSDILVECDEPIPIIYQSQRQKGYNDALTNLAIILAIVQSGELNALSTSDKSIVNTLEQYDVIPKGQTNED